MVATALSVLWLMVLLGLLALVLMVLITVLEYISTAFLSTVSIMLGGLAWWRDSKEGDSRCERKSERTQDSSTER